MSGPYENVQFLDDICRLVMREKETATGCLVVMFYPDDLVEIVGGDMQSNLAEVERKLRCGADQVAAMRAKFGDD